jgi:broad specificity phosphatase PhoE
MLKRTNTLAKQIRREGVGKNPKLEEEYCRLLMQRRRMLQTYELAKKDGERMPDVGHAGTKKALRAVPFNAAPTIYLIGATDTPSTARDLAVSLSSAGIEALACADTPEALATATMLHEVLGSPLAVAQSGFRSWDRGLLHGQPSEALDTFLVGRDEVIPGGESFNTYHARFMTSLTPLLILVGRGIRHTIGVVTSRENLILAQSWLNSGGNLGDLDDLELDEYAHRIIEPGSVLRLSFTAEGWEGEFIRPLQEESPVVLAKGRASRKPMPGQLGMDFDEEAHPRAEAGEHGKYKGGEFVPKEHPASEWAKNLDVPVIPRDKGPGDLGREFANYNPESGVIYTNNEWKEHFTKYQRYGVPFGEAVITHEKMHHLWHIAFGGLREGGNPEWRAAIEALEKIPWSGTVDFHPRNNPVERAVETLAVHTINPDLLSDAEREWAQGIKEQAYARRNAETLTLYRQGSPVGRSGAGTFYTFDPNRLAGKAKRYEKTFLNIHEVPAAMHDLFAGNPSEALRRQWLPHLNPHDVWLKHGKELGHKSAVDTGDWLVAHAAHERGHDGIRYEGLEMQSLLDGFEPHDLFSKLHEQKTVDPREDWKENGVRSQAFKAWFGDWENNPKMASKVVDATGKPQETHEVESSKVTDETGAARIVYHGTSKGTFTHFNPAFVNPASLVGPGFYFTEDKEVAETYQDKDATPNVTLSRKLTKKDMSRAKAWVLLQLEDRKKLHPDDINELRRLKGFTDFNRALEVMMADSHGKQNMTTKLLEHLNEHVPIHSIKNADGGRQTFALYLNIRRPWDADAKMSHAEFNDLFDRLPAGGVVKSADPEEWKEQREYLRAQIQKHDMKRITLYGSLGGQSGTEEWNGRRRTEINNALQEMGYDGVTHQGGHYAGRGKKLHKVWVAFKPEQIKSAENEGTFDPTTADIRKSLGPFVPPDMPRWQVRPKGDEPRYLPLNAVEDRDKLRGMVATMEDGTWEWDKPIICSGDQLMTGSHRYHAAKATGQKIPLKDFGEVCAEGGIDFEKEWRARAEPYGGWISNVSNVIRLFPPGLAEKYGIELG